MNVLCVVFIPVLMAVLFVVFSQEGEIKPSSLVIEQSPWRSDRKPMRRNEKLYLG